MNQRIVLAALLLSLPAAATEVLGNLGLGSPVGYAGVTAAASLSDRLQLEGGVGCGHSGLQLSLMPRLVLVPGREVQLVFGLGPSLSVRPGLDASLFSSEYHHTGLGLWLQGELGLRIQGPTGLTVLIASGLSAGLASNFLLSPPAIAEQFRAPRPIAGTLNPEARVAVGRSF